MPELSFKLINKVCDKRPLTLILTVYPKDVKQLIINLKIDKMKKLLFSMAILGLGTFAMAQKTESNMKMNSPEMKQKMEMKQQQHLDKMKTDLNLSDAQVIQIKEMQEKQHQQRRAKMDAAKSKNAMMKNRGAANDEMKSILTPAQYEKWQASRTEKMQMRKDKMQNKDFKMMRRGDKMQMKSADSKMK